MPSIRIKLSYQGQTAAILFRQMIPAIKKSFEDLLGNLTLITRDAVKARAPVGKGPTSGKLALSITEDLQLGDAFGNNQRAAVVTDDPAAQWVIEGTPPHVISGNPYLAFFWDAVGEDVVFGSVNHPGISPNRFHEDGLNDAEPEIEGQLQRSASKLSISFTP